MWYGTLRSFKESENPVMDGLNDPQYKTAEGAALRIWRDTAQNRFLSEREGRPLFDEVIFCEVIAPGSKDSTPVFELERIFCEEMQRSEPKRSSKYAEYKDFIEDFKKGESHDSSLSGTPLGQWHEMTRSMISALKAAHIYTVEAIASLPDTKLGVVGPDGRTWREKAKAYVENAKSTAFATELAAKYDNVLSELSAGKAREAAMAAQIEALQNAGSKPGKSKTVETTPPVPEPSPVEANPQPGPEAPVVAVAAEGETLVPSTGDGPKPMPII